MAKKSTVKIRLVPEEKTDSKFYYYAKKPTAGEKAKEKLRMKKYNPNDHDEFQAHVDVGDNRNCTRFLVFFVYLSDNEKGGTTFPKLNFKAKCKKGDMLMFPPMWTHVHAGEKPIDNPKYIVGSYLHYVGAEV